MINLESINQPPAALFFFQRLWHWGKKFPQICREWKSRWKCQLARVLPVNWSIWQNSFWSNGRKTCRPRRLRLGLRLSIEGDMEHAVSHRLGCQYALGPHPIDLSSSHLPSDIDPRAHGDSCFTVNHDDWSWDYRAGFYRHHRRSRLFNIHRISFCLTDLDEPVVTVHQSIGEAKEQFYYERTVFLRCVANSNPPVRYSWHRGREVLTQGSDKGVEIYEPFFTQVKGNTRQSEWRHL